MAMATSPMLVEHGQRETRAAERADTPERRRASWLARVGELLWYLFGPPCPR